MEIYVAIEELAREMVLTVLERTVSIGLALLIHQDVHIAHLLIPQSIYQIFLTSVMPCQSVVSSKNFSR